MEKETQEISRESWEQVGKYLRQATVEIVHRAGGRVNELGAIELPEGADEILARAHESGGFSEERYAAVAEAFISRLEEIQEEARPKQGDNSVSRLFKIRG